MNYIDIVGFIGLLLILIAFVLNELKRLTTDSKMYNVLNMAGGVILAYYSITLKSIPFLTLQSAWALFALYNLIKINRK